MRLIELTVSVPPSLNVTRRIDWKGYRRLKAWRDEAGWTIKSSGQCKQQPIKGLFEIDIIVSDKGNRSDIDNLAKAMIDFVKLHGFIEDDSPKYMRAVSIRFEDTVAAGACRIIISPAGP